MLKSVSENKTIMALVLLMTILALAIIVSRSFSVLLDDDVEVSPDTDLTYYLNVSYDGIDRDGVASNNRVTSKVNSGVMYVEDRIPDGLTFESFVTTSNGSIGAVKRSDNTTCLGKVIDDTNEDSPDEGTWNNDNTEYTYHGLHYTTSDRTVRFRVENLQAGCYLTVGIVTKTPATIDDPNTDVVETRRDFYNFASLREKSLTVYSNTVHAFMGKDFEPLYNVVYQYEGETPDGAPDLPDMTSYTKGTSVGVAPSVDIEGYTFSGWTTADISVTNGTFVMPEYDVTFKGSFTQNEKYSVSYELIGDTPDGYTLPLTKQYYLGQDVNVDVLSAGDTFNGYRFLGWTTSDASVENGRFVMPSNNVSFVGEFEDLTYKLEYRFYDGVLPPNSNNYLPASRDIVPGTVVTLDNVTSVPDGYVFLGWYKDNEFVMPKSDVVVYGEWKQQLGTFEPTIEMELTSGSPYYKIGELAEFKIAVRNTAAFTITNVMIRENNEFAKFINGSGYSVLSKHVAKIDSISAGETVYVYSVYRANQYDGDVVTNEAEIITANSINNYELYSKEYKATASFYSQSKVTICNKIDGTYNQNTMQYHITDLSNDFDTWMMLDSDECDVISLEPDETYTILEIVPQDYVIKSVTGAITSNNSSFVPSEGVGYNVTFTNTFAKKGFMHSFGRVKNLVVQGGA